MLKSDIFRLRCVFFKQKGIQNNFLVTVNPGETGVWGTQNFPKNQNKKQQKKNHTIITSQRNKTKTPYQGCEPL